MSKPPPLTVAEVTALKDAPLAQALLTAAEAAAMLRVDASTVSRYCTRGLLQAFRLPGGGPWRIDRASVDLLRSQMQTHQPKRG